MLLGMREIGEHNCPDGYIRDNVTQRPPLAKSLGTCVSLTYYVVNGGSETDLMD